MQRPALPMCMFLAACLCTGCDAGDIQAHPSLALAASSDTNGWIVPCGCTANQSGGMPRRGAYLHRLRADRQVVYVDVGGAPSGTSEYDRLKFEAILRGEVKMGVAAHNIGQGEARLGADYLRQLAVRLTAADKTSRSVAETAEKRSGRGGGQS